MNGLVWLVGGPAGALALVVFGFWLIRERKPKAKVCTCRLWSCELHYPDDYTGQVYGGHR